MDELKVAKMVLMSIIARIMASYGASWFYQWNTHHEINFFAVPEINSLQIAQYYVKLLAWFCGLLVLPFFAEEFVSAFQLQKLKFGTVMLAIESVLLIYALGLSEDLRSGLGLFASSQLIVFVNGIAISKAVSTHMKAGYTGHYDG